MLRIDPDISKEDLKRVKDKSFEVDLHGMGTLEALNRLRFIVRFCPESTRGIYVIHGFNLGTSIRDAITVKSLQSKRVKCISRVFNNDGQSVIVFKGHEDDLDKHVLFG